ncbi:unnamed protein product [Spirodela intermedia]|uniref:Fe2OG dioxygenase domain-containing protein n=1 Tax=Spirodela intermedia TaxID=51605 RepID=A0A7I8JQN2_SPIIN|nr:unnamed protein product [Spirodela intermedia]CAA6672446.1 unnamed protein product [Spirodela intermedia]
MQLKSQPGNRGNILRKRLKNGIPDARDCGSHWETLGGRTRGQTNDSPPHQDLKGGKRAIDLGEGSELIYVPRFLPQHRSWTLFDYLNREIPGPGPPSASLAGLASRLASPLPRDTCYIADQGLPELQYSGYKPTAHSWGDYPPLKDILEAVLEALPGSSFNSLLLNRYKGGSDYVAWHSDDEKLYGPAPEIASVSLGCERDFLLRKKKPTRAAPYGKHLGRKKASQLGTCNSELSFHTKSMALETAQENCLDQHSLVLKHGSLLAMRGFTQRDWLHSIPKRAKAGSIRINLTFRQVQI